MPRSSFLCLACLAAPLTAPQLIRSRVAWLAYLAPLALVGSLFLGIQGVHRFHRAAG
jgi:hypothetical protein